jgi:hypothetical protein
MTARHKQKQREAMINTLTGTEAMCVRLECGTWYEYIGHNLIDRLVQVRVGNGQSRWVRWEEIDEIEKY